MARNYKYTGTMEFPALTELEEKVLRAIPADNFFEQGFASVLWNDVFFDQTCPVPAKQGRAILVTLQKKGYTESDGGKDGGTWLTAQGCTWLIEKGVIDKETGNPVR